MIRKTFSVTVDIKEGQVDEVKVALEQAAKPFDPEFLVEEDGPGEEVEDDDEEEKPPITES